MHRKKQRLLSCYSFAQLCPLHHLLLARTSLRIDFDLSTVKVRRAGTNCASPQMTRWDWSMEIALRISWIPPYGGVDVGEVMPKRRGSGRGEWANWPRLNSRLVTLIDTHQLWMAKTRSLCRRRVECVEVDNMSLASATDIGHFQFLPFYSSIHE